MNNQRNRIIRRRVGAGVLGVIGLFVLCNAVLPIVDGFRFQSNEFIEHLPILFIIAVFLFFLGVLLLYCARRLWRAP
jgi:hypothetical protein